MMSGRLPGAKAQGGERPGSMTPSQLLCSDAVVPQLRGAGQSAGCDRGAGGDEAKQQRDAMGTASQ